MNYLPQHLVFRGNRLLETGVHSSLQVAGGSFSLSFSLSLSFAFALPQESRGSINQLGGYDLPVSARSPDAVERGFDARFELRRRPPGAPTLPRTARDLLMRMVKLRVVISPQISKSPNRGLSRAL